MPRSPLPTRIAVFLLFLLSVLSVPVGLAQTADPRKPIAVLSVAGYDRWYENVALLGEIAGSPDLAQGLEAMLNMATGNHGVPGLDKRRPWAAVVMPQQPEQGLPAVYACLPIDDLAGLAEMLRPLLKNVVAGEDGTQAITLANGASLHAAQRGKWAVLSPSAETARRCVADATPMLGDLPGQYDLAARWFVSRLSEVHRSILSASLAQASRDLRRRPGETDAAWAMRRRVQPAMLGTAAVGLRDLDEITLGCRLDHKARRCLIELALAAKPGTPLAQLWSPPRKQGSRLAGFRLPGAAMSATWSGALSPLTTAWLACATDAAKADVFQRIDRTDRPVDQKRLQKEVAAEVFDILQNLVTEGHPEGAASVVLEAESATWVSAMRLPPGRDLRKKIERCALLARRDPEMRIRDEQDADRAGKVRLHVLSKSLGDRANDKAMAALVGEQLEVVVGLGKEYCYLAAGRDAFETLRSALAASRTDKAVAATALECSAALGPMAAAFARWGPADERKDAAVIAEALKQSAGRDHVRWTVEPAGGRLRVRVALEEGVLRVAGLAAWMIGSRQAQVQAAAGG